MAALERPGLRAASADLAFNTAVSFTTNTNWQAYSGESTVSNFTQMVGLAVHNFTSAATGHRRRRRPGARAGPPQRPRASATSGPTWCASPLYLLLPLSLVVALVLVWQGVPQTLAGYTAAATTLEGGARRPSA